MTPDDIAKSIPDEVVKKGARAICSKRFGGWFWDLAHSSQRDDWEAEARATLAAGLAAWPDMVERFYPNDPARPPGLFLPLKKGADVMSKSDMTLYRFHLAARNASDAALLAWWMDQADEYSNLHHENTEKHLHEAAALLGYDLVKRQSEAA